MVENRDSSIRDPITRVSVYIRTPTLYRVSIIFLEDRNDDTWQCTDTPSRCDNVEYLQGKPDTFFHVALATMYLKRESLSFCHRCRA